MEYLKLFEGFISQNEFSEFFENHEPEKFTKDEVNILGKINLIEANFGDCIVFSQRINQDARYQYRISKFEDEWFIVHKYIYYSRSAAMKILINYYKCDQFTELINYLKYKK